MDKAVGSQVLVTTVPPKKKKKLGHVWFKEFSSLITHYLLFIGPTHDLLVWLNFCFQFS